MTSKKSIVHLAVPELGTLIPRDIDYLGLMPMTGKKTIEHRGVEMTADFLYGRLTLTYRDIVVEYPLKVYTDFEGNAKDFIDAWITQLGGRYES